jgi:hypothetical protein
LSVTWEILRQPGVNLGTTWDQPGIIQHRPTVWKSKIVYPFCDSATGKHASLKVLVASVEMRSVMSVPANRGLHSSTFRLNVSTFCGLRTMDSHSERDKAAQVELTLVHFSAQRKHLMCNTHDGFTQCKG